MICLYGYIFIGKLKLIGDADDLHNYKNNSSLSLLDLWAAFDIIDLGIFIENVFGICQTALVRFKPYPAERNQYVRVGNIRLKEHILYWN